MEPKSESRSMPTKLRKKLIAAAIFLLMLPLGPIGINLYRNSVSYKLARFKHSIESHVPYDAVWQEDEHLFVQVSDRWINYRAICKTAEGKEPPKQTRIGAVIHAESLGDGFWLLTLKW